MVYVPMCWSIFMSKLVGKYTMTMDPMGYDIPVYIYTEWFIVILIVAYCISLYIYTPPRNKGLIKGNQLLISFDHKTYL